MNHCFFANEAFLLAMDPHTRYIKREIVMSVNGSGTVKQLCIMFSRHGLPSVIVTDNAKCFCYSEVATFLKINDIKHITSPPRHPELDSITETGVKVVTVLLR